MNLWMNSTTKMNAHNKIRTDGFFYQLGKIVWFPFCVFGIWFAKGGYEKYAGITTCAVRKRCGLPCPGCGGTRAFYFLFQGEYIKSFLMNPTVIYGILAYFHFMLLFFYRKHISKMTDREIHIQYYMYAAIGVILIQWCIKLIIILFFL